MSDLVSRTKRLSQGTKATYERLIRDGTTKKEARRLIAVPISYKMFDMLQSSEMFNHARFVDYLDRLPGLEQEDDDAE